MLSSTKYPLEKVIRYALNICWLLIQGSLGLLAIASGGDILFYGEQYSSHNLNFYDHYKHWALLILIIAAIPRFVVSRFPISTIPYAALVIAGIITSKWCVDNSHLSLAGGDGSLFQGSLYMLYFLVVDASFVLLKLIRKTVITV